MTDFHSIFTQNKLNSLFPPERTAQFFDALFGDNEEGAYDISLKFQGEHNGIFEFEFELHQRPGRCLACNLTYGLPQVFSRHPIINVTQLAQDIAGSLGKDESSVTWNLGKTKEYSTALHAIPLSVSMS